ncbi:hypothetical protein N7488_008806 [Penicillium malachiteum]|nr:hypothetical protein N7488_008806 [Penicillium malachiteum]
MAGVWFFDRLLRLICIVACGPYWVTVTALGDEYMRVDVAGVRWGGEPGQHVYVYFPVLTPLWPWENHSFSVIPSGLLPAPSLDSTEADSTDEKSPLPH